MPSELMKAIEGKLLGKEKNAARRAGEPAPTSELAKPGPRGPMVTAEYRKDGWPLCPRCGEDELMSTDTRIVQGVMRLVQPTDPMCCHACQWTGWVPARSLDVQDNIDRRPEFVTGMRLGGRYTEKEALGARRDVVDNIDRGARFQTTHRSVDVTPRPGDATVEAILRRPLEPLPDVVPAPSVAPGPDEEF